MGKIRLRSLIDAGIRNSQANQTCRLSMSFLLKYRGDIIVVPYMFTMKVFDVRVNIVPKRLLL